ncbi:MAG: hypothetical protein IPK74_20315 [Deltaproteobacteria bacterium]|nr:hypothetical protein [Deltaproteobacteria bacterium]
MTRHPRAKAAGTDASHESLPTLRLPPVEARAMRREAELAAAAKAAAAAADAPTNASAAARDDDASAGVRDDDAAFDASAIAGTPADASPEDPRERAATIRVQALPQPVAQPTRLGRMARHPGVRRPPLPLPDVLRQGPMPAMKTHVGAAPTAPTPTAGRAPVITAPEHLPEIDTAALVVDLTASLVALEAPDAAAAAMPPAPTPAIVDTAPAAMPPVQVAVSSHTTALPPVSAASPRFDAPVTTVAPAQVSTGAHTLAIAPRRSLRTVVVASAAIVAVAFAGWWLLRPQPHALEVRDVGEVPSQLAAASPAVAPATERAFAKEPPAPVPAIPATPAIAPVVVEPAPPPSSDAPIEPAEPDAGEPVVIADAGAVTPPHASDLPPAPIPVEAAAGPTPTPAAPPAAGPRAPKTSSKAKARKARKPAASTPAAASKPAAVAAAAPSKPTAAPDRLALLREAEQAFAQGRYATALRNAERSLSLGNDVRAARIAALSACKLGRADAARRAFERMPLGQRRGIRNTCSDSGIKL